jgi:hypothetical protein
MDEPNIIIEGERLTTGQAMAVRVAVSVFYDQVLSPEGRQELGPIANAYRDRLREVFALMVKAR